MPFLGKTPSQIVDPEVDIDGGTIDGVSIGSVTANAGAFTNLTATGTLTLPDDGISGDDVNGGTISNFASTGIDDNATSTAITIDASENIQFGPTAVTGGRYFDIYNTGSTATDFAIIRFITQQVASSSTTSADIFKRKNGQFGISNNDTHSDAYINFTVGTAERMRLDASGNLLVGKTSLGTANEGMQVKPAGELVVTRASNHTFILNRKSSDGNIALFQKDGTTVGSIGTVDGAMFVGTDDTGLYFSASTNQIRPYNTATQNSIDATIDLGRSTTRFKDIYLSGGAYLGGTASANYLDDYEEGTWTPSLQHGGTITVNSAVYTKVGRQVVASCYISNFSSIPNDNNGFKITGLPFNSGISNSYAGGSLSYAATSVVDNWSDPLVIPNGNYIYFHYLDGSTGNDVRNANVFSTVTVLILQVIYFTA